MERRELGVSRNPAFQFQHQNQVRFKNYRHGSSYPGNITVRTPLHRHRDKMSDSQKDFSLNFICPGPTCPLLDNCPVAHGVTPYFDRKELYCKFDPVATVYAYHEHVLRIHQVGMMDSPKFRNPGLLSNVTVVVILPPLLHIRNLFFMIAQLPKAVSVEINYNTGALEAFEYPLQKPTPEANNPELLNKNVSRFVFVVEVLAFRQQTDEIRKNMNAMFANVIRLANLYFPGIRQLHLDVPDDATLYSAIYEMVRRIPALNQAVITTDAYNSMIACLFPNPYTASNGSRNGNRTSLGHNTPEMNNLGLDVPQMQLAGNGKVVNGPPQQTGAPPPPPPPPPPPSGRALPAMVQRYDPYGRPPQTNGGTVEQSNRMPALPKERRVK